MAVKAKKAVKKKAAPKPVAPPKPALTGKEIEEQLALVHKMLAKAGATIALMLASRRLNLNRLQEAFEQLGASHQQFERMLDVLSGVKR